LTRKHEFLVSETKLMNLRSGWQIGTGNGLKEREIEMVLGIT